VGDVLYVSGAPGEAAAGLELLRSGHESFQSQDCRVQRFLRPTPRLALGRALRGRATAAMDVSDGLLGDLAKLAAASGVGATLELDRLPLPAAMSHETTAAVERRVLAGGDDYELLFTLPRERAKDLDALSRAAGCELHRIGEIVAGHGVTCVRHGVAEVVPVQGHDHFAG
jgi:thiamine-monophosphate kinase